MKIITKFIKAVAQLGNNKPQITNAMLPIKLKLRKQIVPLIVSVLKHIDIKIINELIIPKISIHIVI